MKLKVITLLFRQKDSALPYEVLSVIAIMLLLLAFVIYVFIKKYSKDEIRAPLEDDGAEESSFKK
ncbi:hypothetical protein PGH12_07010 [Chryseobacterium wangxinyae]|uniref:hypothetical protein n=1 Tax=Chryseobacterium sp. CY350 TaxID=2997336 RepID=UPI002270CBE3|nr:hypothetical protein [Chryseobacterium sp. CY350]MCY0976901.1 hypothetical protein [Chryseobacterium sp. CY350]WBZ96900.1 hypothetical protein PGH12_07010 [Chryseobacterium sp. CY350]